MSELNAKYGFETGISFCRIFPFALLLGGSKPPESIFLCPTKLAHPGAELIFEITYLLKSKSTNDSAHFRN